MEFSRNDKVVNIRTGEFAVFESFQEVTTASGDKVALYQVQPDRDNAPRAAWRAEEIALWPKAAKPGHGTSSTPTEGPSTSH